MKEWEEFSMLDSIQISNFKCFDELELGLRPLTLLCGENGGGKSSVIQALGLLSQTVRTREWGSRLLLTGPDLSVGSAVDVMNQLKMEPLVGIGMSSGNESVVWSFKVGDRQSLSLDLSSVGFNGKVKTSSPLASDSPMLRWLLPQDCAEDSQVAKILKNLSWLTAERYGPRETLPLPENSDSLTVGTQGELAAGLLYWRADEEATGVEHMKGEPPTLFHQVSARMASFFPGCELRVRDVPGASAVTLQMRTQSKANYHRPQNVGFGFTQVFPIVVAALTAIPGRTLVVENPEVHLHPKAQQAIGVFLSDVAAHGIQVIIETHSDHVLNGVRLAVKRRRLAPGDAAIHYFRSGQSGAEVVTPHIDSDGHLDQWPVGFFDQMDHALVELL